MTQAILQDTAAYRIGKQHQGPALDTSEPDQSGAKTARSIVLELKNELKTRNRHTSSNIAFEELLHARIQELISEEDPEIFDAIERQLSADIQKLKKKDFSVHKP